jgi:hypothetical protein
MAGTDTTNRGSQPHDNIAYNRPADMYIQSLIAANNGNYSMNQLTHGFAGLATNGGAPMGNGSAQGPPLMSVPNMQHQFLQGSPLVGPGNLGPYYVQNPGIYAGWNGLGVHGMNGFQPGMSFPCILTLFVSFELLRAATNAS